jgi:hypothetical protein
MNANEFADELEKAPTLWFKDDMAGKWIIEKLRQQQVEIEALKNRNWDLVSEPWGFDRHPAKTLTDEEIEEVAKPYCDLQNWVVDKHEFARAILRKAQEK